MHLLGHLLVAELLLLSSALILDALDVGLERVSMLSWDGRVAGWQGGRVADGSMIERG
jgi:hypothetical protein